MLAAERMEERLQAKDVGPLEGGKGGRRGSLGPQGELALPTPGR